MTRFAVRESISVPKTTGVEKVDAEHRELDMLHVFIALKLNACLTKRMNKRKK